MAAAGVPTADYRAFDDVGEATEYSWRARGLSCGGPTHAAGGVCSLRATEPRRRRSQRMA
ncbi:MAG: hypothetical protein WKH64_17675 [Chloroflexia bacterium]